MCCAGGSGGCFVVPRKIDGSLTRSLSGGRGLGFWIVGFDGF